MGRKKATVDPWKYYEAVAQRVALIVGDEDLARDAALKAVEWCLQAKPARITRSFLTRRALWRALDMQRRRRVDIAAVEDVDAYPAEQLTLEQEADLARYSGLTWTELVALGRDIAGVGAASREDQNAHRCSRYRIRKRLKEVL